jgi:3-dehydroquinate synthase
MTDTAPGAFRPPRDRWCRFADGARTLTGATLVVLDRRVGALHPAVRRALERTRDATIVSLVAGERAKTLATLEKVLQAGVSLPRSGTLVAIGGGTIGDVSAVAAHLLKRGVRLVHVPTTLLAAVDSSLGGKGAVDLVVRGHAVKNAFGVFHYAAECWLCPELFATLDVRQRREGAIEAWKMVACFDAKRWREYRRDAPALDSLVRDARRIKARVCARDPYERTGLRAVLNFGHTFGHVIESVSRFRVSHGDAVGMGVLCALDVGRAMGVTDEHVAAEVEAGFRAGPKAKGRNALARVLAHDAPRGTAVASMLAADKKVGSHGELRMVLLRRIGEAEVKAVPNELWRSLYSSWRRGARP